MTDFDRGESMAPMLSRARRAIGATVRPSAFLAAGFAAWICFLVYYHGVLGIAWNQNFSSEGWWQFLPSAALKEQPIQSLLHLHTRAPVENTLKMLGIQTGMGDAIFAVVNHFFAGIILIYSALFLGKLVSNKAVGLMVFPALLASIFLDFMSMFNLPLYDFAVGGLVLAACYHGMCHFQKSSAVHALAFFVCLSIMSIYRETWSFPFLFAAALIATAARPKDWWKAGLAFVPSGLWILKNFLIFGFVSMSSLAGMTLYFNAGRSVYPIPAPGACLVEAENRIFAREPQLRALAVGTYHKGSVYEKAGYNLRSGAEFAGIAALQRQEGNDWWGASNKNAYEYIQISADFLRISRELILQCPGNYLRNVYVSFRIFLKPAWYWAQPSMGRIAKEANMPPSLRVPGQDMDLGYGYGVVISKGYGLFPLAWVVALLLLIWRLLRAFQTEGPTVLLLLLVIGTGTLTSILFTNLESNRYKFEIEPVIFVLFWGLSARAGLWLLKDGRWSDPFFRPAENAWGIGVWFNRIRRRPK